MMNRERIYQVYCGRWEQANFVTHDGEVLSRLAAYDWKALGQRLNLSHIYLLGLWDVGQRIVVAEESGILLDANSRRCPSAFAIVDHSQIWPPLGDRNQFSGLVAAIHQAGLKVYVDFVANHTGLDHPWMQSSAHFYKTGDDGLPNRAFSGDVSELNYDVPEVSLRMQAIGLELAQLGVDGFRCDMAHLVPSRFWEDFIVGLRSSWPQFSLVAEAYADSVFDHHVDAMLLKVGFNSVYDGALHYNLRQMASGGALDDLVGHLQYVLASRQRQLTHYLSNHDDPFPLGESVFRPLSHLLMALPGSVLVFNGSDAGFLGRLQHHLVEILPQRFTSGVAVDAEAEVWQKLIQSPGFELLRFEAVGTVTIRAQFKNNHQRGFVDFNLYTEPSIQVITL